MDPSDYLHLKGALIYLTKSQPEIQTAVSFGATHSVNPTRGDFEELIHCLKYLESTKNIGLILKAGEPKRDLILTVNATLMHLTLLIPTLNSAKATANLLRLLILVLSTPNLLSSN